MEASLRTYLRNEVDRAVRAKVQKKQPLAFPECSRCGCGLHDWTLGCNTCRERHRAYSKRMIFPHGEAWYETRREEHTMFKNSNRAARGALADA